MTALLFPPQHLPPIQPTKMSGGEITAEPLMGQINLWIFTAEQVALVLRKEATEPGAATTANLEAKQAELEQLNIDQDVQLLKSLGKSEGLTDCENLKNLLQFFEINDPDPTNQILLSCIGTIDSIRSGRKALESGDKAEAKKICDSILRATDEFSEQLYEAQIKLDKAVLSQTVSLTSLKGESGVAKDVAAGGSGGSRPSGEYLRFALLNVRSITKKAIAKGSQLKNLILDHNLDFFLFTETWLETGPEGDKALRSLLPKNQKVINQPREHSRGGGVAIVYSDQFTCRRVKLQRLTTFECVAASVQHETGDRPFLILTVYHLTSKNSGEFNEFMEEFKDLMNRKLKTHSNIIVAGDFNIWVDDEKRGRGPEFLEYLRKEKLEQFVREATHKKGHTLDLVIGREMEVTNVEVKDENISDHSAVYFYARPRIN